MWGNKQVETEVPVPTVPTSPQAQDTNPNKPTSASGDDMGMGAATTTSARATARLGANLHVKGEISGKEALHVDGSVEGRIHLDGAKLTIGASAKLTADLVAREIVVYGSVKGTLRAQDRIEIKKDSSMVGDLTCAKIKVEDGAYLKGAIEIVPEAAGRRSQETTYGRSVIAVAHAEKIAS